MAINVSSWSIRNPTPAILLFVMLTLAGLIGFRAMKIQNFPDIDLPMVTVVAALPGASPGQLETEVARKVENSLATIQGLKHIYTSLTDGTVTITAEFRLEKPTQEAVDDVRDAVSRVRSDLPADLRDPVIKKVDLAGTPILTYTVASQKMDDEALSWFVDNQVTKAMLAVRGVGAVSRVGGVSREVRVELDPARLLALNATAADISRQLRQVQQEASGGRADLGGAEQSVRTIATVQSAEELGRMEVALSDGRRIRLDQVARVHDTVAEPRSAALLDGKPVVGFEIVRSRGASEIEVTDGVRATLATRRSFDAVRFEVPSARVDEHLAGCPDCADWQARATAQAQLLRALGGRESTGPAVVADPDPAPAATFHPGAAHIGSELMERYLTEEEQAREGRGERRRQRRGRGVARGVGHHQPDHRAEDRDACVDPGEYAERGGHALAAVEAQEEREHVAEEGGQPGERGDVRLEAEAQRRPHRQPALERVAEQGEHGRGLVAAAQHVGRAGVARAVLARIFQAEQAAGDDREGNGAEQVGGDDQKQGGHLGSTARRRAARKGRKGGGGIRHASPVTSRHRWCATAFPGARAGAR